MEALTLYVIVRDDYTESIGLYSDLSTALDECRTLDGTWVPVPLKVLGERRKEETTGSHGMDRGYL